MAPARDSRPHDLARGCSWNLVQRRSLDEVIGESRPAGRLRYPVVDVPVPPEKAWFDSRELASYEDRSWRTEGPEMCAGMTEGEGRCRRHSMQKIQAPPTGG